MLERTADIERREEAYLHQVARHNKVASHEVASPTFPVLIAAVVKRLCIGMLLLQCLTMIALGITTAAPTDVQHDLLTIAIVLAAVAGVVNGIGWLSIQKGVFVGIRCFLLFTLALIVTGVLLQSELKLIRSSQFALQTALEVDISVNDTAKRKEEEDWILNGGDVPSLTQRFIFDGPSWFLQWLETQCAYTTSYNHTSMSVLGPDAFFASLQNRTCVDRALEDNLNAEVAVQVAFGIFLAVEVVQVLLVGVTLLTSTSTAFHARRTTAKRPRRSRRRRQGKAVSHRQSALFPRSFLLRSLVLAVGLSAAMMTAVGVDVISSCTLNSTIAKRILGASAGVGMMTLIAVVLINYQWRQWLGLGCLCGGVAFEGYVLARLEDVSQLLAASSSNDNGGRDEEDMMESIYNECSSQKCAIVSRWISHVCIPPGNTTFVSYPSADEVGSPIFDAACQHQFSSLLQATIDVVSQYLSVTIVLEALLILVVLFPVVHSAWMWIWKWCTDHCHSPAQTETEGPKNDANLLEQSSIEYSRAMKRYLRSVRNIGQSDDADPHLQPEGTAFASEWSSKSRREISAVVGSVVIAERDFEAIVRTLIIRRLTVKCKLDVSLTMSQDGQLIFVQIFASDNLLMTTLCGLDYKLQFADAIDPGPDYWEDKNEIKKDLKLLEPHEVKQQFKLLLANNVIQRKEAEWFPTESVSRISARIHALSRFASASRGELKPKNLYVPRARYTPRTHMQYIYKKYPNKLDSAGTFRRSSVLRTVDCLRLTRHILDQEFDINNMVDSGLLVSCYCLHSASRFDYNSRSSLLSSWITYWRPTFHPGEWFEPDKYWVMNHIARYAPSRQPLQAVRDYFGESIGFYFAWTGLYLQFLILPALLVGAGLLWIGPQDGMLAQLRSFYQRKQTPVSGPDKEGALGVVDLIVGFGMIAWALLFAKLWERRSAWYQLQWGATNVVQNVKDRVGFHGKRRRNPVTQNDELHFSGAIRLQRQICSCLCMAVWSVVNSSVVVTLLLIEGVIAEWVGDVRLAVVFSCVCQAALIQFNGDYLSAIAHRLSEWENYQNESAFQNAVVLKVFTLQLLNTFSGLFLIAFGGDMRLLQHTWWQPLYDKYDREIVSSTSKFVQLQTLLISLFLFRVGSHVFTAIKNIRLVSVMLEGDSKPRAGRLAVSAVEEEHRLETYPGAYEDYSQMVMQLGLVAMFSSVLPFAPILALVDTAVELRLDALDQCCFFRRPEPEIAEGIGLWSTCIQLLIKLSVAVALGLYFFTADANTSQPSDSTTSVQRLSIFFACVICCWLAVELFWFVVPSESRQLVEVRARNEYLVERYFGTDEDSLDVESVDSTNGDRSEDESGSAPTIGSSQVDDEDSKTTMRDPKSPSQMTKRNVQERADLLKRLNVAMRRHDELRATSVPSPDQQGSVMQQDLASTTAVHFDKTEATGGYSSDRATSALERRESAEPRDDDEDREESTEEMIVGYYRPVVQLAQSSLRHPNVHDQAHSTAGADAGNRSILSPSQPPSDTGHAIPTTSPPPRPLLSKLFVRTTSGQEGDTSPSQASDPGVRSVVSPSLTAQQRLETSSGSIHSESSALEHTDDHPLRDQDDTYAEWVQPQPRAMDSARGHTMVDLGGLDAIAESARREQFVFDDEPGS